MLKEITLALIGISMGVSAGFADELNSASSALEALKQSTQAVRTSAAPASNNSSEIKDSENNITNVAPGDLAKLQKLAAYLASLQDFGNVDRKTGILKKHRIVLEGTWKAAGVLDLKRIDIFLFGKFKDKYQPDISKDTYVGYVFVGIGVDGDINFTYLPLAYNEGVAPRSGYSLTPDDAVTGHRELNRQDVQEALRQELDFWLQYADEHIKN